MTDEVSEVFNHWRVVHNKRRCFLDAGRKKKIVEALKMATVEDLKQAIEGYKYSTFHNGKNENGKKYLDIELMLRDAKHIEQGLEYYDEHMRKQAERDNLNLVLKKMSG